MSNDGNYHTLLVRADSKLVRKLKLIAAFEDTNMSELIRGAIEGLIVEREKKKPYRELLEAGK